MERAYRDLMSVRAAVEGEAARFAAVPPWDCVARQLTHAAVYVTQVRRSNAFVPHAQAPCFYCATYPTRALEI